MRTLVVATRNPGKLRELARMLAPLGIKVHDLSRHPEVGEIEETGATFAENAVLKARTVARLTGEAALADDSGLEVDALGGRPGVESARWAADGVSRLLSELAGTEDRRARYVCELVVLAPDGEEVRATGTLAGAIASERRGSEGFGYDPIFVPDGETRTVAELGDAWKAEHSHRARAARGLAERLTGRG